MKLTKLHIACTTGANRRPAGGDATFEDGKSYGWTVHGLTGEIILFVYRRTAGMTYEATFKSPKRAAAIAAAIA